DPTQPNLHIVLRPDGAAAMLEKPLMLSKLRRPCLLATSTTLLAASTPDFTGSGVGGKTGRV
ncbi:MAG: hypothetical protein ABJN46_00800, partial [Marinobacter sp.]